MFIVSDGTNKPLFFQRRTKKKKENLTIKGKHLLSPYVRHAYYRRQLWFIEHKLVVVVQPSVYAVSKPLKFYEGLKKNQRRRNY